MSRLSSVIHDYTHLHKTYKVDDKLNTVLVTGTVMSRLSSAIHDYTHLRVLDLS